MKSFKKFVVESIEQEELDENIGGLFKDAAEWEKSAKARGLTVKSMTHPSGEATKYHIAKDKQGNNRGYFDHGTRTGRLKEEVELDEKLAAHTVRGDTYVGVPDRVVAQAKDKVKKMNPSTASDHQKAMNKVLSDMGWEMTAGGKYVREEVNESNDMKMVRLGQKMLDLAPKEKNDMISNAYSKLGDALTAYGTSFGPKNVKDLEKRTGLNQRIIMDLIKRAQQ